ncbi:hypothetical protein [Evansella halocellulosilytica]|uniref:hypothetical protein n=1 Tax=Evansella halocellulosilytica TaxID=2011013 RepID=UPI0015C76385|nr:hypothetical protein [Evansella halocellulosilytica]
MLKKRSFIIVLAIVYLISGIGNLVGLLLGFMPIVYLSLPVFIAGTIGLFYLNMSYKKT